VCANKCRSNARVLIEAFALVAHVRRAIQDADGAHAAHAGAFHVFFTILLAALDRFVLIVLVAEHAMDLPVRNEAAMDMAGTTQHPTSEDECSAPLIVGIERAAQDPITDPLTFSMSMLLCTVSIGCKPPPF
jgi:hypothetical protein